MNITFESSPNQILNYYNRESWNTIISSQAAIYYIIIKIQTFVIKMNQNLPSDAISRLLERCDVDKVDPNFSQRMVTFYRKKYLFDQI
jgi:hypothetical protein